MKFKIDENLPQELADDLQQSGHDADSVVHEGLAGMDDETVLRASHSAGRILLTLDKGIPGLMCQRNLAEHGGVVLFRPDTLGRRAVLAFVRSRLPERLKVASSARLIVVGHSRIRVR
jgi:predicted nuclease of predicted toxin-antitoxin system